MIGISGIYIILNKANWKVYIGQGNSCNLRWKTHRSALVRNGHINRHLQSAFNKYGLNNFVYSVLEECPEDLRDERERYWIKYYNSCNRKYGYNKQTGGHEGTQHTEEVKRKISKANKGRKFSEEHKRKLSEWQIGKVLSGETKLKISESHKGEKNHFYGKKHSRETIQKFSEMRKRPRTEAEVKVLQQMIENNTVPITDEMIKDVEGGMSRRKFGVKYGSENVWRRIKGSYSLSEELRL